MFIVHCYYLLTFDFTSDAFRYKLSYESHVQKENNLNLNKDYWANSKWFLGKFSQKIQIMNFFTLIQSFKTPVTKKINFQIFFFLK